MYSFLDETRSFVRRSLDGATFAWDDDARRPRTGAAALSQWESDGSPEPDMPPSLIVTVDDYRRAIQAHVDATAGQKGYDTGASCASYVGSTNEVWSEEALAFIAWRDAVWIYAYAELAKVQAGERKQPAVADIVAELPPMTWPT